MYDLRLCLCIILKMLFIAFDQRYEKHVFLWHEYWYGILLLHCYKFYFAKKFLRLTMGFGYFMYSHCLVPVIDLWISGRDKVGIRALIAIVELWCIVLCSLFTTAAIRLKFVIVVFLVHVWRCLNFFLCLFKLRSEHSYCWISRGRWTFLSGRSSFRSTPQEG